MIVDQGDFLQLQVDPKAPLLVLLLAGFKGHSSVL